jgi:hypothetical protein
VVGYSSKYKKVDNGLKRTCRLNPVLRRDVYCIPGTLQVVDSVPGVFCCEFPLEYFGKIFGRGLAGRLRTITTIAASPAF